MQVEFSGRASGAFFGGDFSDPTNERLIYLSAAGLVLVGLLLLIGTILWWRRGREEHPALAPLEMMGVRSWIKAPEGDRRRRLNQVRLAGAGGASNEPVVGEPVDLRARMRDLPAAFDDLREPGEDDASIEAQQEEVVAAEEADAEPSNADEPLPMTATSGAPAVNPADGEVADATLISTERPAADAGEHRSDAEIVPVEAVTSGSNEPIV